MRRSSRDIGAMSALPSPVGDRVGLAIDQIAQSGLSSLKVIYYLERLFRAYRRYQRYSCADRPVQSERLPDD